MPGFSNNSNLENDDYIMHSEVSPEPDRVLAGG